MCPGPFGRACALTAAACVITATSRKGGGNIFAAKKMRKKKIVFSSSGGTPAMKFLLHVIEKFDNADLEQIAAIIAAVCRRHAVIITAEHGDGCLAIGGSSQQSVEVVDGTLRLDGDNIEAGSGIMQVY